MIKKFMSVVLVSLPLMLAASPNQFSPAKPMSALELSEKKVNQRIAFGSCANPARDDTIFSTIKDTGADVFLYIGDNVYAASEADDPELGSLKEAYGKLAESRPFELLRSEVPL